MMLASVGLDRDHSLAIHDGETGELLAKSKGHQNKMFTLLFQSPTSLLTAGDKHIEFWTLKGRQINKKQGLFGKNKATKIQPILCAALLGANVVTGQKDGSIYLWQGRNCQKACAKGDMHKGAVTAMFSLPSSIGYGVLSAGKDGVVKKWDRTMKCTIIIDMKNVQAQFKQIKASSGHYPMDIAIQTVCARENKLLIGTKSAQLYETEIDVSDDSPPTLLHLGHFRGETWGLACHPLANKREFVTSGDDKTVRLWDLVHKSMIRHVRVKAHARALAYSPNGAHIAVGLCSGHVQIYNEHLTKKIKGLHVSKEWIQDIRFSPAKAAHSLLAVSSHDNRIYLYDRKTYVRTAICKGHSSYITHIDFSNDGKYLQSNCGAYELLFWDTETGKQKRSASELRDVQWASWTCVLGWPVQGIFQEEMDGTDVNAVHRNPTGNLLATADDNGMLNIFRYPAVKRRTQEPKKSSAAKSRRRRKKKKRQFSGKAGGALIDEEEMKQGSGFKNYKGHASHVTNVRFSSDGSTIITTGGNDKCVFQWKVVSSGKQ
jgi:microtubule-associated protein-like 6